MNSNVFVFVVCGAVEHINALHFSLKALKKISSAKVVVVTDSSRNEIPVRHNNIVDVKTSEKFSHHQASIFLKTKLHKLLPGQALHCYLDADVVAVKNDVDDIFSNFSEPIIFSEDYCSIDEFSPFAVNCGCYEEFKNDNAMYLKAATLYDETLAKEYKSVLEAINTETEKHRNNLFSKLRFTFSKDYYHLNELYKLHKKSQQWLNSENEPIEEKYNQHKFIFAETGFSWSKEQRDYISTKGTSVTSLKCSHFREQVKKDFDMVIEKGWNHWNGGVFLFNNQSHEFMDAWHDATLKIFENPAWKTRDQGSLAATVWKFGLQNHKTLDKKFNFIVDYNNKELEYTGNLTFRENGEIYQPSLLHIFHHFGDKNWAVWNDIEKLQISPANS